MSPLSNDRRRRSVRRPTFFRPRVEGLEDRLVLASHTWTGAFSTAWGNPLNWENGRAPTTTESNIELVFPSGTVLRSQSDNTLGTLDVSRIVFFGGNYTIGGSKIRLHDRIDDYNDTGKPNQLALDIELAAGEHVFNTRGTVVMQGALSGDGDLTKEGGSGDNTLILANTNSYAGKTTIAGGILRLTGANAIPDGSAVTVTAGTLDLTSSSEIVGSLSGTGTVLLNGNFLEPGFDNSSTTYRGALTGAGGLIKSGSGVLTLGGFNSYSGPTLVNGGTLRLGGIKILSEKTEVTVNAGATLDCGGFNTYLASLFGLGTVLLGGKSSETTLTVGLSNGDSSFGGVLQGVDTGSGKPPAGVVAKTGTGTLVLHGSVNVGTLQVKQGTIRPSAANVISRFTAVDLATFTTFDLNGFSDTIGNLTGTGTVRLGNNVSSALGIGGNGGDATYTGGITGAGRVVKVGGGTLTFAGFVASDYTGRTFVEGGTLVLAKTDLFGHGVAAFPGFLEIGEGGAPATVRYAAADQLADGASVFITNGSTLDLNGFTDKLGTIEASGGAVTTGAGTLTLGGDLFAQADAHGQPLQISGRLSLDAATRTFTVNGSGLGLVIDGSITNGKLVKDGDAKLRVSGSVTADVITVEAGTLQLGSSDVLADASSVTVNPRGTLDLAGFSDAVGPLTITGGQVQTGAGTLTLRGDVTATSTAGSTGRITGNVSLGGTTRSFSVADGPESSDLTVDALLRDGGLAKLGPGTLALGGSAPNTYTGPTFVAAGMLRIDKVGAVGTDLTVGYVTPGLSLATAYFAYDASETVDAITVNADGAVVLRNLSGDAFLTTRSLHMTGGSITTASSSLTLAGDVDVNAPGGATISGNLNLGTSSRTINVASGTLVVSAQIAAAGADVGLTKTGAGTLQFTTQFANHYTGPTAVNDGTLVLATILSNAVPGSLSIGDGSGAPASARVQVSLANQLSDTAPVVIRGDGSLELLSFASDTIGPLTLGGGQVSTAVGRLTLGGDVSATSDSTITGSVVLGGARTVTVAAGARLNVPAQLTDGAVNKRGPGRLVLTGQNSLSEGSADAGTLTVDGRAGPMRLTNTAILTGVGVTGAITASGSATVSPGGSPGIMTTEGNIALPDGTRLAIDLNGINPGAAGYDQLTVHGTVALGGTLVVTPGFTPATGAAFTIIDNDGTDPVTGTFRGLPEGTVFVAGNVPLRVSYRGGTGNDVVLTTATISDNALFCAGVYHDVITRAATPEELAALQARIDPARLQALTQVATSFVISIEYRGKMVRAAYQTYLGRVPGTAEVNGWLQRFTQGTTSEEFLAALLGSDEYFQRLQRSNTLWLDELYRTQLGRPRDPGSQSLLDALNRGVSRTEIAGQVLASDEFLNRRITAVYTTYLGRTPGSGELSNWRNFLRQAPFAGGAAPSEQFLATALGSQEFLVRTGQTNVSWVTALYAQLLGRQPAATEVAGAVDRVLAGYAPQRNGAGTFVLTGNEYQSNLVAGYYQTYLGRSASAADIAGWVARLRTGARDEDVIAQFIASREYFQRAGGTNAAWLDHLYLDLLGRPRDPSSQSLLDALNGGTSRAQIAATFLASAEYRGRVVAALFTRYLGRTARADEATSGRQFLVGNTDEQLAAVLVATAEYFQRPHAFP